MLAAAAILALLFTTSLSNPEKMSADQQHESVKHPQAPASPMSGTSDSMPHASGGDPEASKQSSVQCGVLKLESSSGDGMHQIPLYCISGKFYGEDIPTNLPHKELPVLKGVSLHPSELTRWGAYFLNEGSSYGYLLLAPRNWEVASADTGMDGSVKIILQDPLNPKIRMTYLDIGSCMGCAIQRIGSYFPNMEKWADEKGFIAEPPAFISRSELSGHLLRYTLQKTNERYKTEGMAYRLVEETNTQFTMLEIEAPEEQAQMLQTMLGFYSKYPSAFFY